MCPSPETKQFISYFNKEASLLSIPGRAQEVEIYYSPKSVENYLEASIKTAIQIHINEEPGDILVFLVGREEIEYAVSKISLEIGSLEDKVPPICVIPLHDSLTSSE